MNNDLGETLESMVSLSGEVAVELKGSWLNHVPERPQSLIPPQWRLSTQGSEHKVKGSGPAALDIKALFPETVSIVLGLLPGTSMISLCPCKASGGGNASCHLFPWPYLSKVPHSLSICCSLNGLPLKNTWAIAPSILFGLFVLQAPDLAAVTPLVLRPCAQSACSYTLVTCLYGLRWPQR